MKSWRNTLACWLPLSVVVVLLCLGCTSRAWAQAATSLVSVNAAGTDSGNDQSGFLTVGNLRHETNTSADGRFVAFVSRATDLTSISDTNGLNDVFVRDRLLGTTTLVSVNLAGTAAGNAASGQPFISRDGSKVAFVSNASDLTAVSDPGGHNDVFVRDLVAGTTTLVSIRDSSFGPAQSGGNTSNLANCTSGFADRTGYRVWSDDGTKLLFLSIAADLIPSGGGGPCDPYLRDLVLETTTLVSADTSGGTANGTVNDGLFLSADGSKAAFFSNSTDLVSGISDALFTGNDIFVRDIVAGTTQIVSVDLSGTAAAGNGVGENCFVSSFSEDGNLVAFTCWGSATELVAGITDFNGTGAAGSDVFVRNLTTGITSLVSVNSAGTGTGDGLSEEGILSPDGSLIAFRSEATDLVSGIPDGNGFADLLVRDLATGTTSYVTVNAAGTAACTGPFSTNSGTHWQLFNDSSNRIAFHSGCTDLVAIPTVTVVGQVYTRDLPAGPTVLQSINAAGTNGGNANAAVSFISGDGETVIFTTVASNLGATDTNVTFDVYARPLVVPEVSIGDVSAAETNAGTTTATFTVTLSAPVLDPVTVDFQTMDNTATVADSDYVTATGTVTFLPGDTSEPVSVTVNGDTSIELDETFFVNLSNPSNATILDGQGVGTITDDDAPTISINDVSVTEGDAGTVNLNFTVSLSSASVASVTVDFITNGVTATSGTDFVANSGTVTFAPSDVSEPVTVTINGDTKNEFDETFTVDLSNATNATIADAQGVGTILDNDPAPTLSINDVSQAEGNSGTSNMVFTVSLSAVSGKDVSVNYLTADNSATQPSDYTLTSGTLSILAGSTSGPVSVPIVGDTTPESDETFFVNLSAPVNAAPLEDSQGKGTITDDDSGPPFTMTPSASNITCTAGATAQFNVTIAPTSPPLNTPVTFSCSGNPPQSTCTITPSSVTPGSSPATVQVQIHTTASSALLPLPWERERLPFYAVMLFPGLGLMGLVMLTPARGKRPGWRLLEIALLLGASLALLTSGCGGGTGTPGTPSGAYTVTITGTSGSGSNSTTISLTVHQ